MGRDLWWLCLCCENVKFETDLAHFKLKVRPGIIQLKHTIVVKILKSLSEDSVGNNFFIQLRLYGIITWEP